MDLIQAHGQPLYGRFTELPSAISPSKYIYKTPYGKIQTGWRKRLKYKKFKFCSIQHEQYSIGVAIVDIAWAGHGFIYIYDHESEQVLEWNAINPLARNTIVDEQPLFNHSHFERSNYQIDIQHANGVRYICVHKSAEEIFKARIFCAGTDPLSMCSPTGINGWTYTQKSMTLAVEGFFINKQQQKVEFNSRSFAALDDTCGFLRPETAWFWLSCNFWDQNKHRIGINLASGVNESFGNENSLWIDGRLYPLADMLFEMQTEHLWTVRSLDETLHLSIETAWRRYENLNLRMVGSQFSQWQSKISGTIASAEHGLIHFDHEYGLLEQHYAKW